MHVVNARRVVFVDDDPLVLRSIRRLMSRSLASWDLVFASSGDEALAAMAAAPVDVVVSDLNMGQMDGAALLQQVQDQAPEVVRIILSGSTSREEACLTTSVAHQFLAKPFDSSELSATLTRALSMRGILGDDRLRQLVAGANELPAVPALYVALTEILRRDDASLVDVAALVEQDPAASARMMQLTCSSFIGRRTPPRNIREAVIYVGVKVVKALVLTHHIVTQFKTRLPGVSADQVQEHGTRTGALASLMLAGSDLADDAFLAGMLHGVGRLLLASRTPRRYRQVLQVHTRDGVSLARAERDLLGASHAEVGAYLFGLWGLPHSIVDAVATCHRPTAIQGDDLGVAAAVYLASRLIDDPDAPVSACGDDHQHLDAGLVERLGGTTALEGWRAAARQLLQSSSVRQ